MPKAVIIDTCFLRANSHKHPEMEKLWEKSRSKTVEIFIPHIALEEWRTQKVDELMDAVLSAKSAIQKVWRSNIIAEELDNPNNFDFYPTKEMIVIKSKERMARFLRDNNIQEIEISESHMRNAWQRYFDCRLPFNPNQPRDARRKDIPDAWILEAAIEKNTSYEVHCLLSEEADLRLMEAFEAEGLRTHKGLKELLRVLEPSPVIAAIVDTPPTTDVTPIQLTPDIKSILRNIVESDQILQARILGYVNWFAPVPKTDLATLLQRHGHASQAVSNAAERLALGELIKDSGNHYLPANRAVCEEAANSVMPEILEILDSK